MGTCFVRLAWCSKLFLLVDLRSLLSSDQQEELFRASLNAFVTSNPGFYHFCTTSDCPSIYQVAPADTEDKPFVCGAYSVEICTKCHLEYHSFISCEAYQEYKEDPEPRHPPSMRTFCSTRWYFRLLEQEKTKEDPCNVSTCQFSFSISM